MVDIKSPLRELALFAGAGGGILGGKLLGWRTVCAVEWEPYAACVLAARQNDGLLPPFPIWDDIQTFDGRPWRGIVDVVSGGFPCQDISAAGKGAGIDGERSGMWKHMARVVDEVRPRFVFVENSPMLVSRGLSTVLADLTQIGYDARWSVVGAADVGAPHQRDRLWLVAHAHSFDGRGKPQQPNSSIRQERINEPCWSGDEVADAASIGQPKSRNRFNTGDCPPHRGWKAGDAFHERGWSLEPDVGRVANGVAARVDRLKAIGNGQVPLCAATAWRELSELL